MKKGDQWKNECLAVYDLMNQMIYAILDKLLFVIRFAQQ